MVIVVVVILVTVGHVMDVGNPCSGDCAGGMSRRVETNSSSCLCVHDKIFSNQPKLNLAKS